MAYAREAILETVRTTETEVLEQKDVNGIGWECTNISSQNETRSDSRRCIEEAAGRSGETLALFKKYLRSDICATVSMGDMAGGIIVPAQVTI